MTPAVTITARLLGAAKIPTGSLGFAVRIWAATVLALFVSFWLQLEAPSTAALTVAILAEPTRGQALEKAAFRLIATVIGVAAAIAITGLFSQTRDLILVAFAAWLGICVFAAKLLDGYQAYAAVLSGYTVAFIATQQIDNPQHVFQAGMERGAAIAVGVLSIAFVNLLMFAPERHPRLAAQLAALHRRVRAYANAVLRGEPDSSASFSALIQEIAALRPEIASAEKESSSGASRAAAARSAAVALVAELQAARALSRASAPLSRTWAAHDMQRRDDEVHENLLALRSLRWPQRLWRTPLYRSWRAAAQSGVRAALWFAIASALFVAAGWPATSVSLSLVAVVTGLGATTPNPRGFTALGLVGVTIAIALGGLLEFVVLDGADDFLVLALALAPFTAGAALLLTSQNPLLAAMGRLNLIFIPTVLAPSNPQSYNPQAFLFTSLFLIAALAILLAAQTLIPPVSNEALRKWLAAAARRELRAPVDLTWEAPEEATFRDATRLGQFLAAGGAQDKAALADMLSGFDQSAIIRLCDAALEPLGDGVLAPLVDEARAALIGRDTQALRDVAHRLRESPSHEGSVETEVAACLTLASDIIAQDRSADSPREAA
jgi:uncharacterized membrane protein YccC